MRIALVLALLTLTACSYSRVTVTTVVVKTSVDKSHQASGEIDVVPQILKALPEAEKALEAYRDQTSGDNQ